MTAETDDGCSMVKQERVWYMVERLLLNMGEHD